jgi:hypothetical protein
VEDGFKSDESMIGYVDDYLRYLLLPLVLPAEGMRFLPFLSGKQEGKHFVPRTHDLDSPHTTTGIHTHNTTWAKAVTRSLSLSRERDPACAGFCLQTLSNNDFLAGITFLVYMVQLRPTRVCMYVVVQE